MRHHFRIRLTSLGWAYATKSIQALLNDLMLAVFIQAGAELLNGLQFDLLDDLALEIFAGRCDLGLCNPTGFTLQVIRQRFRVGNDLTGFLFGLSLGLGADLFHFPVEFHKAVFELQIALLSFFLGGTGSSYEFLVSIALG
jgi:hypothetical protein